jgi:magnesium-transporting ATPase (P-type)
MPSATASRASARAASSATEAGSLTVDPQERIDWLLVHLGTRAAGLSPREAQRRLAQFGANEISRAEGPGWWRELLRQLVHPLALLLWVAAGLAAVSGSGTLAIAIVAVIVLNAALAYAQELQAERATEALRELLPIHSRVRPDGSSWTCRRRSSCRATWYCWARATACRPTPG